MNPIEFSRWYRQQYHAADKLVSHYETRDYIVSQTEIMRQVHEIMNAWEKINEIVMPALEQLGKAMQAFGEAVTQTFTEAFKPFEDMFGRFGDFWQDQASYENKAQLRRTRQRSNFRDIKNLNRPDDSQRSRRSTYWWGGWRRK